MLASTRAKFLAATQTANDRFAKAAARDAAFYRDRQKSLQADAAKTARLRALRLDKEAADRESLAKADAERRATAAAAAAARPARRPRKSASP